IVITGSTRQSSSRLVRMEHKCSRGSASYPGRVIDVSWPQRRLRETNVENKMPGRPAQELEVLVRRGGEAALRLVDQAAQATGEARDSVQNDHGQPMRTGLASGNDSLSLLRLFSFNTGEVVDGLYRILLGREADAQGRRDYERMLGLTGSRL